MTNGGWETFAADLSRELAGMQVLDSRIYSRGARYVQIQAGPPNTALETSSNNHLPPGEALIQAEEESLRMLGWNEPNKPGQSNWFRDYPWPLTPAAAAEAAELITGTVKAILRPNRAGDMKVETFNAQ